MVGTGTDRHTKESYLRYTESGDDGRINGKEREKNPNTTGANDGTQLKEECPGTFIEDVTHPGDSE